MRGTLRRKKRQNKIGIISSPSEDRKCTEINKDGNRKSIHWKSLKSIKVVKELELTDRKVSKSLLSSKCTYILLRVCCSHKNARIYSQWCEHRLLDRYTENAIVRNAFGNFYRRSYIFYCMLASRIFLL